MARIPYLCLSQNHFKKNVRKINHEYFGGSDVTNVSLILKMYIFDWLGWVS
jgi:hypothetical protein